MAVNRNGYFIHVDQKFIGRYGLAGMRFLV